MTPQSSSRALTWALLALALPTAASAQQKPTLTPADYGRWEQLGAATLAPDGRWLAYGIERVDGERELRVRPLDRDTTRTIPWASAPLFSADGRWLAWTTGPSEAERKRLEKAKEPVRNGAGLLELATGTQRDFGAVAGKGFDATGRFLALHGYPPEEPEGKGADLRLLDLSGGTEMTFGNVAEFAWSDVHSRLALAVATGDSAGNGVQVYDAATGRLLPLDASGSSYRHLAWREDAADLAVLRSVAPAGEEGTSHTVLAWRGLDRPGPERLELAARPAGIPDSLEVVEHAAPRWSDDGARIAIGLRPIEPDSGEERSEAADSVEAGTAGSPVDSTGSADAEEPELPSVQIWHSADVRIYPQQKARAEADARRTLLAVWELATGRVVQIGTDLLEGAELLGDWRYAVEWLSSPYPWGAMFGRPYADRWVVDVATGERRLALERVRYSWDSADGRYLLSFDGRDYWTHELSTGERRNLTAGLPTAFADTAYDTPTDLLPPHGVGGWLEGDAAVLLYDEFDVWRVAPDGSGGERLTRGAEDQVVHRVQQVEGERRPFGATPPPFDPDRPIYLSLRGEWTERQGYGRILPDGRFERLVFGDHAARGLQKADSAEVFVWRAEAADDSPDYFVAGADLASPRQVTGTNPFQDEFAWTRSELVEFESETGRRLHAGLLYPAGYDPSRRYPMIVYTYELLTPGIHRYRVPSERDYYSFTAWTQQGYFVLLPDIVFRARDPGVSAVEAVRPAVAKIVEMGLVDADRVGHAGHSWGGYEAAYFATHTDIFAAAVAGAPLTDFVSFMGQIHWGPGFPELSHWETGQARMEVPYWEDPEAHHRNSPIHRVHEMETPLLMAFGDEDGVVDWDQGTEFYNFARRAGKQMVLLVYEGEDHGFRQEPNQKDYHRRILEWFGHYLKGEPAPAWITEGVPLSAQEAERRRVAEGR
ncbi:MAG TPA: prolyl oligopeptidase family serine peptidase [Longimicrobiales bacterium]|nr:prolyl oligopeptidase family serine peptidase [Longimicrobiales bacterium]